jgi:integrase
MRHTNANNVREEFGLEHTQAVLGHAHADMTQHYAKVSSKKAAEVARKIG